MLIVVLPAEQWGAIICEEGSYERQTYQRNCGIGRWCDHLVFAGSCRTEAGGVAAICNFCRNYSGTYSPTITHGNCLFCISDNCRCVESSDPCPGIIGIWQHNYLAYCIGIPFFARFYQHRVRAANCFYHHARHRASDA